MISGSAFYNISYRTNDIYKITIPDNSKSDF